jgi:predicted MFS family arabinose efflux permease
LVIFMGLRLLPAARLPTKPSFDWVGMLALAVLLSCLAYGLNQLDTQNFLRSLASASVWPFLLAALALLVIFPRIETRAKDPVLRMRLFRSRQSILAMILSAGAGLGEVSMVFMPSLAVAAMAGRVDRHTASYLLMPVVLAMAVGSPLVGRLLDRFGSKVVVFTGSGLLAVGVLMLSTPAFSARLITFILSGVVIGAGLSALLGAPVRYIMLNEAPASDRASAQGAIALFTSIGQLISSSLVGAVAASQGGGVPGYSAAYLTIGGVALVLVLLTLGLKNRSQERLTQAASRVAADGSHAQG